MNNQNAPEKLRILITGGCGKIGSYFVRSAAERYSIRIADRAPWDEHRLGRVDVEIVQSSLPDLEACRKVCEGMDMVVHLAADGSPRADFYGSLLENNFLLTYNMIEAARQSGCKRFIFASSIHAVASYPLDVQVHAGMPVRPTSMYGVSKCFGEAVACHYAVNLGLPSIAMRIGAYLFPHEIERLKPTEVDAYLHPDDFNHLLVQCLETPDITFAVVHAISNNRYKRLDLTETMHLVGYRPQADGFALIGGESPPVV